MLKSEVHSALEEPSAHVVLVENSFTDAFKRRDTDMLESLKSGAKKRSKIQTKPWKRLSRQRTASRTCFTAQHSDSRILSKRLAGLGQDWTPDRSAMERNTGVPRRRTSQSQSWTPRERVPSQPRAERREVTVVTTEKITAQIRSGMFKKKMIATARRITQKILTDDQQKEM